MSEKELEKKPVKKKGRLAPILFGLLFLVGFGILAYPNDFESVEYLPAKPADQ